MPQDWAKTQNNLGVVLKSLGERLEGEGRRSHLDRAIQSYDLALEVYTSEDFPYQHSVLNRNRARARRLFDETDPSS